MKKIRNILIALALGASAAASAQTLDTAALAGVNPSTAREVWNVARYVKLTGEQQVALAEAFEKEAQTFMELMAADGGVQPVASQQAMTKLHEKNIASVLDYEQLRQYWRGVFDKEANAEGNATADKFRREHGITDQNWKFIRIAFYKIGLDSRVNNKVMPAAEAKKANADLRKEMLKTIEEKGGIRINDDMTLTVLEEFNPNTLHRE